MSWILLTGLAWVLLAVAVAAIVGRAVALADRHEAPAAWTDDVDRFLEQHASTTGA